MRRLVLVATLASVVVVLVVVGVGLAGGGGDRLPPTPVPRVCWFSDYENARLSNGCEYDWVEGIWFKEVEGRRVPASELTLPVANLCHYFHGLECPEDAAS